MGESLDCTRPADPEFARPGDIIGFTSRGPIFLQAGGDDTNDGDDGDDGNDDNNDDGSDTGSGGDGRAFSQEDVDRIVADRLKREQRKYSDYDDLKKRAEKLAELENANKDEKTRLSEELESVKTESARHSEQLLKLRVALDQAPEGMQISQVRKLAGRLQGSTQEEFEEDAKDLFADFAKARDQDEDSGRRRPKEKLRPGSSNKDDSDDDMTDDEILEKVLKGTRGF